MLMQKNCKWGGFLLPITMIHCPLPRQHSGKNSAPRQHHHGHFLGLTAQADVKNAINGQHRALSPVTLALRKLKNDGQVINGTLVGAVAAAIARGETGAGQLGEPFANNTPLQDSGIMLATITYNVGESE